MLITFGRPFENDVSQVADFTRLERFSPEEITQFNVDGILTDFLSCDAVLRPGDHPPYLKPSIFVGQIADGTARFLLRIGRQ